MKTISPLLALLSVPPLPVVTLVAAILSVGCHRANQPDAATAPSVSGEAVVFPQGSPQLGSLAVEAATVCESPPVHLNGRMEWDGDVTVRVFTPFAGRVGKIPVELGQTIAAGTTLATIASPDYGQAQANARKAKADLAQAQHTVARLSDLAGHGAVPKKDLQFAEADLIRATAEQERTVMQLRQYGGDGETIDQSFRLQSPIDGVVVEKNLNPGQEVRPDQMLANAPQLVAPLFTISEPRRLWVQIDVSEAELPRLKIGDAFVVHSHAYPDLTFPGEIKVVADAIDPTTHMVLVRGAVDNSARLLKAEMFVTIDLKSCATKGIAVADKAVFLKGEKHFVYVEQTPGRFLRREVKVGCQHAGKVVLHSGVQAGDRVVTCGCLLLEAMSQSQS